MEFGHTGLPGHRVQINDAAIMPIDILLCPYHLPVQVLMRIDGLPDGQYLLLIEVHDNEVTPKKIFENKKIVSMFTLN
jgi:hypothetical protein